MVKALFQTEKTDWLFLIPATTIWVIALFVTAWDFVQIQGTTYRFGIVNGFGLGLGLSGAAIRRVAKRTLGKYYSIALRTSQEHELITHGIYKHVRHPAYLGALMATMAIPLFFASLHGLFLMLGLVPCYLYRIKIEEIMLVRKFGDEYQEYMKKTKRMIPFVY